MAPRWLVHAAWTLGLAAVYFAAGKLGLTMAFEHASATAVWPPTGIALAALLVRGGSAAPGVFLGAFLVNLTTAGSVPAVAGIAAGNTLEGLAGAWLVRRFAGGLRAFDGARDVFKFALLAGLASTLVSATLGVTSLCLDGAARWDRFGAIWLTWWLGDASGTLVVAPLLILFVAARRERPTRRELVEAGAGGAVVVALALGVFGGLVPGYPLEFLCLPMLVWMALRTDRRATATAVALLAGLAIWGTVRGGGPFAPWSRHEALLLLQAFMGVASVTVLALAAAVRERQDLQKELSTYHSLITHDAGNFSMAVLGLAEFLLGGRDGPLSDRQQDLLRRIRRQGLELNRLAENARLLMRLRERGLPPPGEPLPLDAAVRRTAETVRAIHFERAVDVVAEVPDGLLLPGVPLWENILLNLVDNAVRHTAKGQAPKVRVTCSSSDGRIAVTVAGGAPLDASELRRLLESWPSGDRPTGHGMGLSLVREVVKRAGGTLLVATAPLDGQAMFEVTIAFPKGDAAAAPEPR